MILLQASHIAKQYDGHEVIKDANLTVQTGERVALVGVNGAGKSTLLRIVVGEERADEGNVSLAKGATLGYVSQFVEAQGDVSVYQFVAESFENVFEMERRLRQLEKSMADPDVYSDEQRFHEVSETYDRLQQEFTALGGYAVETQIRRILVGLRFPRETHDFGIDSLSGGQRTRLSLARLLAWQPNLLVLDEPTNYLDTDTLSWLEDYLQNYSGSLLVISHDRYFLDKLATVVYELEDGTTTRYVGNYSDYLESKLARQEQDVKRFEAQQKDIQRMEEFVQKNIVRASTTKRAQSRRKLLERIQRLERPQTAMARMAVRFECNRTSGKDVLQVKDLVIGYEGKPIAGPLNLFSARGQRLAIIGPNGAGKTTFLKSLIGRQQPLSGSLRWGTNTELGYYDQEQSELNYSKTVLEQIHDEYPGLDLTTVRTALGRFLFRGEDVQKPVASLSGGERSRLALCRLMLTGSNVLILDEPTNHLDLLSKEVLEDALQDYEGTILFVSHDRYFIDAIATHILVLEPTGFTEYIGNYSDYIRKKNEDEKWGGDEDFAAQPGKGAAQGTLISGSHGTAQGTAQNEGVNPSSNHSNSGPNPVANRGNSTSPSVVQTDATAPSPRAPRKIVRSADLRKLREKVARLEAEIANLEAALEEIGGELAAEGIHQDYLRAQELEARLHEVEQEHEERIAEWEQAALDLEQLEAANAAGTES